jgi:hypothetical protein
VNRIFGITDAAGATGTFPNTGSILSGFSILSTSSRGILKIISLLGRQFNRHPNGGMDP